MSDQFYGRAQDLARLGNHLDAVRDGEARLVSVRGRRQAGKSRLVTEFVERTGLPYLFVTGSKQHKVEEDLDRFTHDAAQTCTLPGRELLTAGGWSNWEQALRAVAAALPDGPAIVVFDEFPWLLASDPGLEGTLQKLWDRVFERQHKVLFLIVGSDLAVMEMLTGYDRPLYGRAKEMVVSPFHLGDTAEMLGLGPTQAAEAFDAYLVTGGYPRLLTAWRAGGLRRFVNAQLSDDSSDLIVVGQRIVDAEFPPDSQAAHVLRVIGAGERTFANIGRVAGIPSGSLARTLALLQNKRVVAVDSPTSIDQKDEPRYRVADPYLRFWLRFVEDAVPDISRGRPDIAQDRVWAGWEAYRGQAVEPLVREALTRLAVHDAGFVGGWWPRNNNPEVDLVGIDRRDRPRRVSFVGSIKWKAKEPFDRHDLDELLQHRAAVPGGAAAPLLVASRRGCRVEEVECFTPDRLLEAWT